MLILYFEPSNGFSFHSQWKPKAMAYKPSVVCVHANLQTSLALSPCSTYCSLFLLLKHTMHICPSRTFHLLYYLFLCSPSYLHKALSSSFNLLSHVTLLEWLSLVTHLVILYSFTLFHLS